MIGQHIGTYCFVICCCLQFFASKKKKKSLSPSLKPGKGDRDPKATLEASPSGKGSLDSYLVTSQDDNCTTKPLCRAHVSSDREGPVKRNLTLEISSLTSYENGNVSLSAPYHPQSSEAYGEAQKEQSQVTSYEGDISDRGLVNSESAVGAGKSELKQFAADFLSLYCRYCHFPLFGSLLSSQIPIALHSI